MTKSPMIRLGLGISTMGHRLEQLEGLITRSIAGLREVGEVVVVMQKGSAEMQERICYLWERLQINASLRMVLDDGVGLSRSRNIVLAQSSTDYVWFLDDDVTVLPNAARDFEEFAAEHEGDIYACRARCYPDGGYFGLYGDRLKLRRVDLLRVCSVQIIMMRDFALSRKLGFRENFGYGTEFPGGAENMFLIDAFDKGARVYHLPKALVKLVPDPLNFEKKWNNPAVMRARGVVARRMGGAVGVALICRWSTRLVFRGLPIRRILNLADGFLCGSREFRGMIVP